MSSVARLLRFGSQKSLKKYEVLIIGGGISGTALFYELCRRTNLRSVGLLEKYGTFAAVNSAATSNSQTLHCGDIETNYTLSKAINVNAGAQRVVQYAMSLPAEERNKFIFKYPKMLLGVGDWETKVVKERHETFVSDFPHIKLLDKEGIAKVEPNVALLSNGKYRKENLAAIYTDEVFTTVNYQELSSSFMKNAVKSTDKETGIHLNTIVKRISHAKDGGFHVETNKDTYAADAVVVSTGPFSILFAHRMGYGKHLSCLPVAGGFFYTPHKLNGKVYTVQNPKLPFAAVHGDPDLAAPNLTRWGPTALLLPTLERFNIRSFPAFLRALNFDFRFLKAFSNIFFKEFTITKYMIKNFMTDLPLIRNRIFLPEIRKIVPSTKLKEVQYAHHVGGVRPQLIDKKTCNVLFGEAKVNPGNGILFNVTPSPGATICLDNAHNDAKVITDYLGKTYYDDEEYI